MKNRPAKIFCLIALLALASDQMLRAQTNKNAVVESATNAAVEVSVPAATNANVVLPPKPRSPTRIEANRADFDLATREATYFENVRVDDPDMKLRCEWLAANLPQAGGHVDHIVAKTNVVIDFTDEKGQPVHATGEKAVYSYQVQGGVTNETITLTGNPQIEDALGTQTGDEIVWDRVNNRMSIPRNAKMVSRQNLNGAMSGTNSPPATNPPAAVPR
jgi:lipopolysaccharide transport protein LptA